MSRNAPTTFLPAVLLLVAVFGLPIFAKAQFTWNGANSNHSVGATSPSNWDEGVPTGDGSEDFSFGDISTNAPQTVILPADPSAVNNIAFNSTTGGSTYTFSGTDTTSNFVLIGNVTAGESEFPSANVTFDNSLQLQLSGASNLLHPITVWSPTIMTVQGVISETGGSNRIELSGSGALALSGANTFSGGLTALSGSSLLLGGSTVGSPGSITSGPVGTGQLTLHGGAQLQPVASGGVTLANAINLVVDGDGDIFVHNDEDVGHKDLALTGVITGAGGLDWCTTGTLTLTNATNTFTGGVDLRAGTLLIGSSSSLIPLDTTPATYAGPVGSGPVTLWGNTTLGVDSSAPSGPITLHNDVVLAGTPQDVSTIDTLNRALTLAGVISGSGNLTKNESNLLTLSGDNTFTGNFFVNGGSVNLAVSNHAAGLGKLEMGNSSTVNFQTAAPVIHGLSAGSSSDNVYLQSASTLTIDQNVDTTFAGHIDGHGGAAIIKNGTGSLAFTAANDYDGGTTINAGTLVAGHNTALGTGAVTLSGGTLTVNAGTLGNSLVFTSTSSVLAGDGTFNAAVNTGGFPVVISPGNFIGNLTFANGLTLASGSAISFQVDDATSSSGHDLITVSAGVLNLTAADNTLTFNIVFLDGETGHDGTPTHFNSSTNYSWKFASATANPITGFNAAQFHLVTEGASAGLPGTFSFSSDTNNLYINFTPVPEPSTYALLLAGLGAIALQLKRRRIR